MAVRSRYALGNPNTLNRNKKYLQQQDVIEQQGRTLQFVDPLFKRWIAS